MIYLMSLFIVVVICSAYLYLRCSVVTNCPCKNGNMFALVRVNTIYDMWVWFIQMFVNWLFPLHCFLRGVVLVVLAGFASLVPLLKGQYEGLIYSRSSLFWFCWYVSSRPLTFPVVWILVVWNNNCYEVRRNTWQQVTQWYAEYVVAKHHWNESEFACYNSLNRW